jgi:hypothetical protein
MFFGRNSNSPEYDPIVEEWINGSDEVFRSIGINLCHDMRVSPDRSRLLDHHFDFPRTSNTLMNGIKRYKQRRVLMQREPDFVVEELNFDNFVSGRSDGTSEIDPDIWVVRVFDLNGLSVFLQWAKYRYDEFASFPQTGLDSDVSAWWSSTVGMLPANELDELIAVMLEALGDYGAALEYQPAWVTTWAAMEPHLDLGADRWAHAVGVQPASPERWLILLKYRARRAGRMAVPTQLDSGWYHYFFPTPPTFPAGHPMDISADPAGLIPEYIHCQITYTKEDYVEAGRRLASTAGQRPVDFPECRTRHHKLLGRIHGTAVSAWMPKEW